jgi:tripartite-type tricarboxylate transporter receptor subunit TctC
MSRMRTTVAAAALGCIALAVLDVRPALAQSYPVKPIRLINPFPAGSATENSLRVIAGALQPLLGQNIVIEPRPGARAILATRAVFDQPADGYTLLVSQPLQCVTSALPNAPYDVRKDMTHIIQNYRTTFILAVNSDLLTVKTVKELIDHARANPGKLNFSNTGVGSLSHLGAALFAQMTNINVVHIPYNGSAPNVTALSRGDGHVTFDVLNTLTPRIQAGSPIRLLAASSAQPSPQAPELPGMQAVGLPGFNVTSWSGISGRAGLPAEVVERFNTAMNAALKDPKVVEFTLKSGNVITGGSSAEFTKLVAEEVDIWAEVIRKGNLKLD